jgi:hypothetical protein
MQLYRRDNEPTIDITHALLDGGTLRLWLVEGISNDTVEDVIGLEELRPTWESEGDSVSYRWAWGDGYALEASAVADKDVIDLHLRLTNGRERELVNAKAEPCLQFKAAPSFCDVEGERSILFGADGPIRVCDTRRYTYPGWWRNVQCYALAGADVQTREGFLVPCNGTMDGRWGVSPDRIAHGLIASERKDGQALIGVAWESARYVSKNYNDSHHCLHSTGYFGDMAKGEAGELRGRIWFVEGGIEDLFRQYRDWNAGL